MVVNFIEDHVLQIAAIDLIFIDHCLDLEFGRVQARNMLQHLWTGPISNAAVDVVQGLKSVEVRPIGVSKVHSFAWFRVWSFGFSFNFIGNSCSSASSARRQEPQLNVPIVTGLLQPFSCGMYVHKSFKAYVLSS